MVLETFRVSLVVFSVLVCWAFVLVYWTEPWRIYNKRAGWSLWGSGVTLGIIQTSYLFATLGLLSYFYFRSILVLTTLLVIVVVGQRLVWTVQVKKKRKKEKERL